MPEEREDVETKSSDSPEVHQQTKFMAWFEKAFPWLLVSGAALGLLLMIFLPVIFFQEKTAEQLLAQSNLRLALLYTTGGTIAALGLLETYRKNTNDRAKANADIKAALKNQEHQAEVLKEQIRQFDDNAFKERKAERRERYTKAVEQLGDAKAPVRMGGVYTLVGLVDEWLEEENLPESERFKEGQVIINNLCAYIRSPFTLASYYDELSKDSPISDGVYKDNQQEFYTDKAEIKAEADVRLGIIQEIHDRLQGSEENTPGIWSDFEYNFSRSTFFYPVDLTSSYYKETVTFRGSTYQVWADFRGSTYQSWADFRNSTYQKETNFDGSTYRWVDFRNSTYQSWADFRNSTYEGEAVFDGSIYQDWANFRSSIYKGRTDFSGSTYQKQADFSGSTYTGGAYFRDSIYKSWAYFRDSTYENRTDFSGSIFYSKTYFGKDGHSKTSSCFTNHFPQFYDMTNHKNTLFGSHNNDFTVDTNKGYPIYLNKDIPLDCELLIPGQKNYLKGVFHEMEKINNKILETKGSKENAELLEDLRNFNKELHEWREEATTVKVEDAAAEDTEN